MDIRSAYDVWAAQYDTDRNRTRDLEGIALRKTITDLNIDRCLEIGCGTGKNTEWLVTRCEHVTAVDFSTAMLARAKEKVLSDRVHFKEADITMPWTFTEGLHDLVTFSLVLEHITDLDRVMQETARILKPGGKVYIGELHPLKQYDGTKARFATEQGTQVLPCFDHHVSDFLSAARGAGLHLLEMEEFFDMDDRSGLPRVLVLILQK